MIIIGENIHILSKVVADALQGRQKEPLQELAIKAKSSRVIEKRFLMCLI